MAVGRDLKPRTFSALILAPVVLAVTYFGGVAFLMLWTLAGFGVLWEWAGVARIRPRVGFLVVGGGTLLAAATLLAVGLVAAMGPALLLGAAICAAIAKGAAVNRGWAALGLLCACAVAFPVVVLRGSDQLGFLSLLFLFAVVWGTDIAAYFTGRALGGPKLWPRLSPNKTWSGALGGTLIGTLAGVAVTMAWGLVFTPALVVIGLVLSVVAQSGDLAESAFKRVFGVKDAGWLIPGHGGILDRLDGFAAAAVLALVIALVRGGASPAAGLLLW